ncbi:hypothetical protein CapIbe_018648 [Capra ibex]
MGSGRSRVFLSPREFTSTQEGLETRPHVVHVICAAAQGKTPPSLFLPCSRAPARSQTPPSLGTGQTSSGGLEGPLGSASCQPPWTPPERLPHLSSPQPRNAPQWRKHGRLAWDWSPLQWKLLVPGVLSREHVLESIHQGVLVPWRGLRPGWAGQG